MKDVYYGWWLVGVAGLVMLIGITPMFYGMAAWFPVLERRFQWTRAQLSLAFSLSRVEGSLSGPIAGYLIDRLGSRRMAFIGLLCTGLGFVMFSQINGLWQFYLAYLVASIGVGLGTWLPMMTVLNSWFIRRRATAMSRAMAMSALGGILLVPVLAWGIDPDRFGLDGWRNVALGIGIFTMCVAFPVSRLVRNRPEDYGLRPDGDPLPAETSLPASTARPLPTPEEEGFTWRQAIRTKAFWLISVGHGSSSAVIVTVTVHLGSILNVDRGFSLHTVGLVVATYTAVGAIFNLVGGYMGDRVPIRLALFWFTAIQAAAVVVLLVARDLTTVYVFAVLMGIGFGGRAPLTSAIRGVYFGRKEFASITGVSQWPGNLLMFSMPIFAGYMYDAAGNYNVSFGVLAAIGFTGSFLFLFLGEPMARPPSSVTESGTAAQA